MNLIDFPEDICLYMLKKMNVDHFYMLTYTCHFYYSFLSNVNIWSKLLDRYPIIENFNNPISYKLLCKSLETIDYKVNKFVDYSYYTNGAPLLSFDLNLLQYIIYLKRFSFYNILEFRWIKSRITNTTLTLFIKWDTIVHPHTKKKNLYT